MASSARPASRSMTTCSRVTSSPTSWGTCLNDMDAIVSSAPSTSPLNEESAASTASTRNRSTGCAAILGSARMRSASRRSRSWSPRPWATTDASASVTACAASSRRSWKLASSWSSSASSSSSSRRCAWRSATSRSWCSGAPAAPAGVLASQRAAVSIGSAPRLSSTRETQATPNMSASCQRAAADPMRTVSPRSRRVWRARRRTSAICAAGKIRSTASSHSWWAPNLPCASWYSKGTDPMSRSMSISAPATAATSLSDPEPSTARASSPDCSVAGNRATISSQRNCRSAPGGADRTNRTSEGHPAKSRHAAGSSPSNPARAAVSASLNASASGPTSTT